MSGYNIEYFLRDFADRTLKNLNYIEKRRRATDVYEVTQLINSLLGLIVLPVEAYEAYEKRVSGTSIKSRENTLKKTDSEAYYEVQKLLKDCESDDRYYSNYKNDKYHDKFNVSKFVKHLRNSISHSGDQGIHFYPLTDSNENLINGIIFKDCVYEDERRKKIKNLFCIKLTILELQKLIDYIVRLYCEFKNRDSDIEDKQNKYKMEIKELENIMANGL